MEREQVKIYFRRIDMDMSLYCACTLFYEFYVSHFA